MAKAVGKRFTRIDGYAKVTGKAQYPDDIEFENMLYAGAVRSTIPFGRLKSINVEKAKALPGVVCILDHTHIPGEKQNGVMLKDMPFLVVDQIRRVGDPIAVVVAEDKETVKKAISLVEVEYEEWEGIFTIEDALKEDAREINSGFGNGKNITYNIGIKKGNVEEAFKNAKYVLEDWYQTQHIEHSIMQPEAGIGRVAEDGVVEVYVATQYPHYDLEEVARVLGVPQDKVRIMNTAVGGAFGCREDITLQAHCALAAFYTRRPVKIVYSREESTMTHCKRSGFKIHYKSAADENGKLVAAQVRIYSDGGAYMSWTPSVTRKSAVHATGPYEIPNVDVEAYGVYTNNSFTGAMRGFGALQAAYAYETQMDRLAHMVGMHPLKFRYINGFKPGSITATGQNLGDQVAMKECIEMVAKEDGLNIEEL